MLHHLNVHTGEISGIECDVCFKLYQSKTSYDSHIRNNQCCPTDQEEQDVIETIENGEGGLEQLNRQVEEEGGEGIKSESSESEDQEEDEGGDD